MTDYSLRLATPEDDEGLRRMLRENPIPGNLALAYEREPDFFTAAGVDGPVSQTIVAEEHATGAFLGMGTRIIRPVYVNGEVRQTGYMSHLRVNHARPWGLSMARQLSLAFEKFRELHADGSVPFYLMSIIDGNRPAQRILSSRIPGLPRAHAYTRMFTDAISPRRPRPVPRLPGGVSLERARAEHIPALLECLQRNGAAMQFAPYWSRENLFDPAHTPNLSVENFFISVRGSRVVGCLALWDQTPFKQSVVRGYSGALARWRPAINLLARVIDVPYLPPVGASIRYCFASHLAVDDFDRDVFSALLAAAYNETARRGFNYFLIGLAEGHPLRPVLTRSYLHITYPSQIYLMAWEDGLEAVTQVDDRLPGLEIAVL